MKFNVDDLIEQGLVIKKTYKEGVYRGLSVLKYHRKVFYDNLWHLDDRLLECRGIVVDEHDNVIVRPLKKLFNLGENGVTIDPNRKIVAYRKINGFMLTVTNTKKYGVIYSTTGSLDSDFVELGKKHINHDLYEKHGEKYFTYIFEICDKDDPHIIDEDSGQYELGKRDIHSGFLYPTPTDEMFFGKFKNLNLNPEHEGWIIYDDESGEPICKVKSKFYLNRKALMRVGVTKANKMFDHPELFKRQLDEEFYELFDFIIQNFSKEQWLTMSEQERKLEIEMFFDK